MGMPKRKVPLVSGHYYHVYNRGLNKQIIAGERREYKRMQLCWWYYQRKPGKRLSFYLALSNEQQQKHVIQLAKQTARVKVLCYSLMPNHYHLLIRQEEDMGISGYVGEVQNSYTRYYNIRNRRDGALFGGRFKAVLVESDEQLVHLSRYIHLNAFTSGLVNSMEALDAYPWSSWYEWLHPEEKKVTDKSEILSFFTSMQDYREFIADQRDYQRDLGLLKSYLVEGKELHSRGVHESGEIRGVVSRDVHLRGEGV